MDLLGSKLIAACLIFLMAIIAGWFPFRQRFQTLGKQEFSVGEALASGIFLGIGLIHMLAEANHDFSAAGYVYPFAFFLAGSIFLLLLLLEHIGMELTHSSLKNTPIITLITVFMLAVHSLLEGAALGAAQTFIDLLAISVAILAHKWAASFSLAIKLNQANLSIKAGVWYFMVFALMTPLGIIMATVIIHNDQAYPIMKPIFDSLAAGAFIYIGTLHGLKRSIMIDRCCNLRESCWLIIGFLLMALLVVWE